MEEVALVSSEQLKFQKSVKGIKNLLKSGKIKPRTDKDAKQARFPKREKKIKKKRGLVYISHIPHGFYENEMTQYFRQFGVVTNVRVLRSSRTGRSKGAGFVEFLEPTVAEIVAETMNNYLMGKRLLKAKLIPPEKQKTKALRKNWNTHKNPASDLRLKLKKKHNENGTDEDNLKLARKLLKNVLQTKKKLKESGVDYDFFQPVDIPLELRPLVKQAPSDIPRKVLKTEEKIKPDHVETTSESEDKDQGEDSSEEELPPPKQTKKIQSIAKKRVNSKPELKNGKNIQKKGDKQKTEQMAPSKKRSKQNSEPINKNKKAKKQR